MYLHYYSEIGYLSCQVVEISVVDEICVLSDHSSGRVVCVEDHDKGSWPALDEDTSALVGPIRQVVDVVVEAQGHVSTQPRATVVVAADITFKQRAMKISMDIVGLA